MSSVIAGHTTRKRRGAVRFLAVGMAIALVAAGWSGPYCRNSSGDLTGRFAACIAAALALGLTVWTVSSTWKTSARWLALGLVGQAAALQLIDAGILIHYQHYRPPILATGDPLLLFALLVVGAQTLAVTAGLIAHRAAILAWIQNSRRIAFLAAVIVACGSTSAAVSREPSFFVRELCFAVFIQLVNASNILLVVWALSPGTLKTLRLRFDFGCADRDPAGGVSIDRYAVLAALWITSVSAFLSFSVYQHHPHVADEVVYLYNARYFATGKVVMPPPPVPQAFEVDLMENTPDKWYGAVPLGWPAVLSAGVAIGAPWLINPVLAGINVLLSYLLLAELYSRRIARIAILLLCVSPWHIFVSMSYMTHSVTMTCALAGFLGVARARRTGLVRWAWLAGFGVGLGSVVRPLDGLITAVLIGAWAVGIGNKRLRFPALAALAAGTCLTGVLAMPYNKALTGDPLASPLMRYTDKHHGHNSNAYGFGPDRGMGWGTDAYPGHTPFEALINAELNGASLNVELFGWSTGSLALIAVLVFSGSMRRPDYLMASVIAAVLLAYAPYWGNGGPDFGARYWYLILLPCVALSARGLVFLEEYFASAQGHQACATAAVAALCCLALINYLPWRSMDKYYHYLRMRPDVQLLAQDHRFGRSLVLIRGARFPDYASAAIYNPIDLSAAQPVYAWDRSSSTRREVLQAYQDRPVWILEGPTITGSGFRVAAGPLRAQDLTSAPAGDSGH
jgi:hypothetical protein